MSDKRPFSDKLAQEVIEGQVKRIKELEDKLATVTVQLAEFRNAGSASAAIAESEAKRKETAKDFELAFRTVRQQNDSLIVSIKSLEEAQATWKPKLEAAKKACGPLADLLARDMDDNCKYHADWWKAVEKFRKLMEEKK